MDTATNSVERLRFLCDIIPDLLNQIDDNVFSDKEQNNKSSSKKKILLSRNNSFLSSQYFNRFNRNCEFKKLNNNLFFLNPPLINSKYLFLDTGNSFFLKSIKNSFNLKLNKNIFNYRLDFSLFKYFFLLNYNTF